MISALTGEGCRSCVRDDGTSSQASSAKAKPMSRAHRRRATLVVKVGSSLVTNEGARPRSRGASRAGRAQIAAAARARARRCVLVSSGAIAEGMQRLGWTTRPHAMHELQAAAAVGQMGLVQCYEIVLPRARPAHRAGAADARRPGRPPALPQRALDAAHAARARRRPGHQRERHRGHRRDPLRRQRHARRAGHQPDRGRRAGDPHRPGRASTTPIRARTRTRRSSQSARRRRPGARGDGRRRRQRARQRRHADQGAGGASARRAAARTP